MPGRIQVSVLDFKELPSSSNYVKLSLGKLEYEAVENATFSFPLTNLRDNMIITIQDSEGNQVSHSGVQTTSIIEKGAWDDVFPIEGGGLIHLKLEFILSDEERNRIRLMRESAMKKKQAEILGSRLKDLENAKFLASSLHRHEVSDVLRATSSQDFQRSGFHNNNTSLKASESFDGIKEESFQRQSFTNATDRREETPSSHVTEEIEHKPNSSGNLVEKFYEQNLEEKIPNDVKKTNEESTLNENNEILRKQAEVPEKLLEDTETRDFINNNVAIKSKLLENVVGNLDKQNLEEKNPSFLKKMSKESKFPPFPKETEVNTIKKNESQLQETDLPKRLQDSTSGDVGPSRLTVAEKIKSFSPKLAGEPDKQGLLEKTPRNIKKMISVFESSLSQDRVPLKPPSTKSYRFGTSRLLKDNTVKDYYEKSESNLKSSEKSNATRLRNSFSTGDLGKNLSSIIKEQDQVGFDDNFVDSSEINMQSKGNIPKGTEILPKEDLISEKISALTETNTKEDASVSGRMPHEDIKNTENDILNGRKTSKDNLDYFDHDGLGQWTFLDEKRQFCMTAQGDKAMRLSSDCRIEEKGDLEKIVASMPEIVVKGEDILSPVSADVEASNGSFGQGMKIALVVGFGILVLLFRQRETDKGKKRENTHVLKNQVFMNKRGSIEEQRRRIGVSRLS